MSGLGSFKGEGLPALPSMTGGLGSFSGNPSGGTVSPGLPTVNPNTGTTSFQQMYAARNENAGTPQYNYSDRGRQFQPAWEGGIRGVLEASGATSDPAPMAEFFRGDLSGLQGEAGKAILSYADTYGHKFDDGTYGIPSALSRPIALVLAEEKVKREASNRDLFGSLIKKNEYKYAKNLANKIKMNQIFTNGYKTEMHPADLSALYTGSSDSPFPLYSKGGIPVPSGYASGGLVSLGSAYRSGGAVEQQAAPHSPDLAPQPSSPDANPQTEKLYMGAMMALDPEYPMSEEDRSMIIETFIAEFGEDELVDLEAEVAARSSDGRSDSIPATLGGKPAALSEGEYVVPADAVSGLGQGSTEAGARRLDDLVRQTRAASAQNVGRPIGPSPLKGIA